MHAKHLFDLKGQVALITGGSRGLGLQMAEALGEMGARVVVTARNADELARAAAHLQSLGIEAVLKAYGQIDILVNNAGATWGAPAEDYPDAAWHKVMTLNVDAPCFLAREVGKRSMIPRRSGKIINIASIAGLKGSPAGMQTIAYNTSKAAVLNFTRALAAEWGRYDINVNAICPGFFPSKMTSGFLEKLEHEVIARTPLQRSGDHEDLKGAVVFLASRASRHVTGQYLAVDGGASIV
jgi:NAD(P)-dependent dehydrogenase (short-subunit alcohol dehydrogenase family)